MKREEIKSILPDITDEQLNSILKINGADIEKAKSKVIDLETELSTSKENYEKLKSELDTLNANNASAEEWKTKYETLVKETQEKDEAQKKAQAEKAYEQRFLNAKGEKEFSHSAILNDYLKKFIEEITKPENIGKADADIFNDLTKDDETAFKNITSQLLPKPTYKDGKKYSSRDEIMAIKNDRERQQAIADNAELFNLDLGGN